MGTSHTHFVALVIDVTSFRSTEELPEPASILVGHAETLLPLLSLLGLYKDPTPPTASNYHTQHGETPHHLWAGRARSEAMSSPTLTGDPLKTEPEQEPIT